MRRLILCACIGALAFSFSFGALAQHKGLSFQAVLQDPEGRFPTANNLTAILQIMDPITNCVLREEHHSGVGINNGYLNLVIGSSSSVVPVVANPTPALSLAEVMDNTKPIFGFNCTFNPTQAHGRKLRLKVQIPRSSGGTDLVEADFFMRAVAYAVDSETLNGKSHTDFININSARNVTQENLESIFERFTQLEAILNNSNAMGTNLGVNITGNAATSTSAASVTGVVDVANGGTGASTVTGARGNLGLGSLATLTPTGTANATTYLRGDGSWATVSGGNLNSVGVTLPSDVFQTIGSPLTSDGAIGVSLKSQTQKQVFAAPNTADGMPSFRQLLVSDISNAKSAALYDVPIVGDAGSTQVVKGDDSRLVNARAPLDNSVTAEKIASGAVTDVKIDTVSANKITGTISSGSLPVASETTVGIVNVISQAFKGVKTFVDNVIMQGSLSVGGAVSADRIRVANSSAICEASTEGSLRYNSTSKKMEYCNGTLWTQISQGTQANVSIGSPSSSLVKSGPVNFDVTYGSGTDVATITLSTGNIILGGTNTAGCLVTGVTGVGAVRTVTINGCTGTGTVNISVVAGTANSTSGDGAAAAGPSTSYGVDNTGPTAPAGVTLGSVPSNLTNSPTITYTAASDVGGSTVANHQVQIIKTSDGTLVKAWANHTSGSDVGSLSLATNTEYSVLVRAVDTLGNIGTSSTSVSWISINDPCLGSPTPGTVCTGGAIYLGSLSWGSSSVVSGPADRYMTTPGGCGEIPAGQKVNTAYSPYSDYPNADFTPICSGTDSLMKTWNDGSNNFYHIGQLSTYIGTIGTGHGGSNKDDQYGSQNSLYIVPITGAGSGGYHAAARYCDKLNYGGYSDWYLPNRYELNLFFTNKTSIPGLNTTPTLWYYSSTEGGSSYAWFQQFSDGAQDYGSYKSTARLVRCVRRY